MSQNREKSSDPAPSVASGSGDVTSDLSLPDRTTPALLLSLALHVLILTTAGLLWTREPAGTGEEEDRPIGIALVHRLPDRDRYVEASEAMKAVSEQTASEASPTAAAAPPADLAPPIDLAGVLESMESTPLPTSGSGLAGETKLDGDAFAGDGSGSSSGASEQATTTLFGISGSGSRFVYVFDRSDSMNGFGGRPLRAAKAELIRSLRSLTERQQFQLIFYNDKPSPFKLSGLPLQMISGEATYRELAENHIRSVQAFGGTEHEAALKMALRMGPDIVFFLTDARIPRLSSSQLQDIKSLADSVGATIHAIEFGPEPGAPSDSFLRTLAAQNLGQYRYINVQTLALDAADNP